MYSMFDLLFDTPAYRSVYVISDSEMKELQRAQNQDELEEIRHQKKRLEEKGTKLEVVELENSAEYGMFVKFGDKPLMEAA